MKVVTFSAFRNEFKSKLTGELREKLGYGTKIIGLMGKNEMNEAIAHEYEEYRESMIDYPEEASEYIDRLVDSYI